VSALDAGAGADAEADPVAGTGAAAGADLLAEVGARIERVLEHGDEARPVARDDARDLVRSVTDLYGAVLEQLLTLIDEAGALDDALLSRLAEDPLVGSLLLVHGLHPDGVDRRVAKALDELRPQLERHEVTVEAEVVDRTVHLRVVGAGGCVSTSAALIGIIRGAVEDAAPDAVIEVETARATAGTFIPLESLLSGLGKAVPA